MADVISFDEARSAASEFVGNTAVLIGSRSRHRALLDLVVWAKRWETDHDGTDHGGLADVAAAVREASGLYIAAVASASFYQPTPELREQLHARIAEMVEVARRAP